MNNILIIDDEPGIRAVLRDCLEDENYAVFLAEDGYKGLSLLENEHIDLVILDVWLPNMGGIDVLEKIREQYVDVEVIMISGHANINLAVKAVKMGAFDFLEKPLSLEKTITVVRNAMKMEDLVRENRDLKNTLFREDEIIGQSDSIQKVLELVRQSAEVDSRVLITGENGTGKELVAREIHRRSKRANGPFVEVNCAAIPETLIESELFGHEKGAFTGAIARRRGKFEMAHTGTLFLDEVADMSLSVQAKLLRVIQELKFERVGGEKPVSVDVRLIAATNKNIAAEISSGNFREDLFFRLNVIPIFVPPLRERREDIKLLVDYFMKKFQGGSENENKILSKDALKLIMDYSWPGNIRELKNFMERINILTEEKELSASTVEQYLGRGLGRVSHDGLSSYENLKLNEAKERFERELIERKLKENDYNVSRTAQELGIYPSNLHGKIKRFGINIER